MLFVALNEKARVTTGLASHNRIKGEVGKARVLCEASIVEAYKMVDIIVKANFPLTSIVVVTVTIGK